MVGNWLNSSRYWEDSMRQGVSLALVALTTIVAGCGRLPNRNSNPQKQEATGVPVQVAPVEAGTMVEQLAATGTISALRKADVQPQILGRVVSVGVREGDSVRAGQVVVTLDRTELESQVAQAKAGVAAAQARLGAARKRAEILRLGARAEERSMALSRLEQAEAGLRQALADRDRMRTLYQQGAVSKQQLDAAETGYDTARTNRDAARDALALTEKGARPEEIEAADKEVQVAAAGLTQAQSGLAQVEELLSHTVVRSPVSGIVYERNIEPGEIASLVGGPPLLRVADLQSLYLEATVPERLAHQVEAGQRVIVAVRTGGNSTVEGRVQRLVPVADPSRRDFVVWVVLTNSNPDLRPGVFAEAKIIVAEHRGAVMVPKDALVTRGDRTVVFVARAGKVSERSVRVGLVDRTHAEILSGISPGEPVVVVGAQALKDGDRVQVGAAGGQ